MSGFVNKALITGLEVKYDVQEAWMKRPNDIQIIVKFTLPDNDRVDWEKTLKINGSFNKENSDKSWGSAIKVKMFLEAVGINKPEHKEDFTISDSYIDQAMGKEIMILSYPSVKKNPKTGKSYWNDWDNVGSVYKGMDNLKSRFDKSVNGGYVRDLDTGDALNSTATPTPSTSADNNFAGLDI